MVESGIWQEGEGAVVQLEGVEGGEGRDDIQVHRVGGQVKLLGERDREERIGLQCCSTVRFGLSPGGTEVKPAFLQSAEMLGHLEGKSCNLIR